MEIWKLKPLREKFSLMNNVQMLVDWLNVTRICHGYLLNFAIQISVFCGNAGIADKLRCTSPIFFVRLKKAAPRMPCSVILMDLIARSPEATWETY